MNNVRRKAIRKIIAKIDDIQTLVDKVLIDEQRSYDNMPEQFQSGIRGQKVQEIVSDLEFVVEDLESCIAYLESTIKEEKK